MQASTLNNKFSRPPLSNSSMNNQNLTNIYSSNISVNNNNLLQSPTSSSKIHQYFSSSQYISQQQQLSIFIQDFPIISLQTHRSLNQILPLLIKQNQLLGKKCQQQIIMIKQSFIKHQNLIKNSKKTKQQMQEIKKVYQQYQNKINFEKEKIEIQCKERKKKFNILLDYVEKEQMIFKCFLDGEYKKCEELTNQRNFRIAFDQYRKQILNQNNNQSSNKICINLQQIQKHCKFLHKKFKYYSKVKLSVQQFCGRLIKINSIVPTDILKQQLQNECQKFLDLINTLINLGNREGGQGNKKKKRNQSVNQELNNRNGVMRNTLSSVGSESSLQSLQGKYNFNMITAEKMNKQKNNKTQNQQKGFFQDLVLTIYNNQKNQTNIQSTQLTKTIESLKTQLSTCKQYYESYLINIKMQFQTQKRTLQQQLMILKQTSNHYENQLEKYINQLQEFKSQKTIMEEENKAKKEKETKLQTENQELKRLIEKEKIHCNELKEKINQIKDQYKNKISQKQKQYKNDLNKQINKSIDKQKQFTIILQTKKKQIIQLQSINDKMKKQIKQLKQTLSEQQSQKNKLIKRLHQIQHQQINKLQGQIQIIAGQIKQYKQQNKQLIKIKQELTHQVELNTSYIKQLQVKLQTKQASLNKINSKLSTLEQQKKSNIKQKQLIPQLQSNLTNLESSYHQSQQQNSNLKRLIKQMKKQLQSVYHTLNDLKSIQKDRQRLIVQNQKSQRWKQQIMKDYDQMKYEIMKVQTENRDLKLEVKHYKNVIKRIEMIK